MAALNFTLTPDGVARMYDAISCLAKFSEVVGLEAYPNKLLLVALNSSMSAYASYSLDKKAFFHSYKFSHLVSQFANGVTGEASFTCQVYNKALLAVFKGRGQDMREKNAAIQQCDVCIQDQPDKAECRIVVKMICAHGVKKTYKLTYDSVSVRHARNFDKKAAKNRWKIGAHMLKAYTEHFGAKTELLDIYHEGDQVTFTSYTEKIMNGNEILKQPLQTSIAINTLDFLEFDVEEKLHIGISVKDFKAIVIHGETVDANVSCLYNRPGRPLLLAYSAYGMQVEFTLMTIGEYRGSSATPVAPQRTTKPATREPSMLPPALETRRPREAATTALPSASRSFISQGTSQRMIKPPPPLPKASIDHESLFFTADDDEDRRWAERNYDEEDELGWDASADHDMFATGFPNKEDNSGFALRAVASGPRMDSEDEDDQRIAPTQRVSQVRGIFDD